jgi:hypothetical protein
VFLDRFRCATFAVLIAIAELHVSLVLEARGSHVHFFCNIVRMFWHFPKFDILAAAGSSVMPVLTTVATLHLSYHIPTWLIWAVLSVVVTAEVAICATPFFFQER